MDWMRRQDVKEESQEAPNALTPEDDDECYFEEDVSIDEGMVRVILRCDHLVIIRGTRSACLLPQIFFLSAFHQGNPT